MSVFVFVFCSLRLCTIKGNILIVDWMVHHRWPNVDYHWWELYAIRKIHFSINSKFPFYSRINKLLIFILIFNSLLLAYTNIYGDFERKLLLENHKNKNTARSLQLMVNRLINQLVIDWLEHKSKIFLFFF